MIEQLLQGHLEELRVIRENAMRPRAEQGVGPDGGEDEDDDDSDDDEDDDSDLDLLISGGTSTSERPPSDPQTNSRPPSPDPPAREYHGMYS